MQQLDNFIISQFPQVLSRDFFSERKKEIQEITSEFFKTIPTIQVTRTSEFYHPFYNKSSEEFNDTAFMQAVIESLALPISGKSNDDVFISVWGDGYNYHNQHESQNKKKSEIFHVLFNAALFGATRLGNCDRRTSFAALQIFKLIHNKNFNCTWIPEMKVAVRSLTEVNHFVMLLKTNAEEMICCPLTNPEIVFDQATYMKKIISLFQRVLRPALPLNLTISQQLLDEFETAKVKVLNYLEKEIMHLTKDDLESKMLTYNPSLYFMFITDLKDQRKFLKIKSILFNQLEGG